MLVMLMHSMDRTQIIVLSLPNFRHLTLQLDFTDFPLVPIHYLIRSSPSVLLNKVLFRADLDGSDDEHVR
jgi:hypothetical protein